MSLEAYKVKKGVRKFRTPCCRIATDVAEAQSVNWYPAGRPFDDTENESLYPAFYFAKNYAKQSKSHVYGTRYEKG